MSSPYRNFSRAIAVSPSDSTDFAAGACRGFYVGGTGNVVAIVDGTTITFNGCQAGSIIDVRCTRINNTNTTATGLLALY